MLPINISLDETFSYLTLYFLVKEYPAFCKQIAIRIHVLKDILIVLNTAGSIERLFSLIDMGSQIYINKNILIES